MVVETGGQDHMNTIILTELETQVLIKHIRRSCLLHPNDPVKGNVQIYGGSIILQILKRLEEKG